MDCISVILDSESALRRWSLDPEWLPEAPGGQRWGFEWQWDHGCPLLREWTYPWDHRRMCQARRARPPGRDAAGHRTWPALPFPLRPWPPWAEQLSSTVPCTMFLLPGSEPTAQGLSSLDVSQAFRLAGFFVRTVTDHSHSLHSPLLSPCPPACQFPSSWLNRGCLQALRPLFLLSLPCIAESFSDSLN